MLKARRQPERLEDHPTVQLVAALLHASLARGASDLHVAPDGCGAAMARVRVDGMLHDLRPLSAEELPRVIARLKVLAGLSAFRTGEPQDGAFRVDSGGFAAEARLATLPVRDGERASIRFLDSPHAPRDLGALGLMPDAERALRSVIGLPAGAVVVVGPCSSGKSTTMHALLRAILAARGSWVHAATIEDPVEMRLPGATQVEVDKARGLGFAQALASLLRHDPQVLLVGETRDPETARLAVEAAFTGHLLLTSLHVGALDEIVPRLSILGVPEHLIRGALRAGASLRLVRRLCSSCGGSATGCEPCAGSGYRGRFAIAEVALFEGDRIVAMTPTLCEQAEAVVEEGWTRREEIMRVLGEATP